MLAIRGIARHALEKHQFEYYSKWYYSAVFNLLQYYNFDGDYDGLARKLSPSISAAQARKAVDLLVDLGLVKVEKGSYVLANRFITCGEHCRALAVRMFQEQTMLLAAESLKRHPPKRRDISTATVSIREEDLPAFREVVAQFRTELLKLADETEQPDSVYQINIQLFPMTTAGPAKEEA
jgi:uncharacterized protein (TIGR02147 family)